MWRLAPCSDRVLLENVARDAVTYEFWYTPGTRCHAQRKTVTAMNVVRDPEREGGRESLGDSERERERERETVCSSMVCHGDVYSESRAQLARRDRIRESLRGERGSLKVEKGNL
jgi:hypothetical protein